MGGLLSGVQSTINALASYITSDDFDRSKVNILLDNCIKQYKCLLRFLDAEYNAYMNNINTYKDSLNMKLENGPFTINYMDEEFCKNTPRCLPSIVHLSGDNVKDLNKGFTILTQSKLRYFIKLDDLADMNTIDSKFQKAYRGYLCNAKKKLISIDNKKFETQMKMMFKLTAKDYTITSKSDIERIIPSKYTTSEYSEMKSLLNDIIDTLQILKTKALIPGNIKEDNKSSYLIKYGYRLSSVYMHMYNSAHILYTNKMRTRVELLKDSI